MLEIRDSRFTKTSWRFFGAIFLYFPTLHLLLSRGKALTSFHILGRKLSAVLFGRHNKGEIWDHERVFLFWFSNYFLFNPLRRRLLTDSGCLILSLKVSVENDLGLGQTVGYWEFLRGDFWGFLSGAWRVITSMHHIIIFVIIIIAFWSLQAISMASGGLNCHENHGSVFVSVCVHRVHCFL